MNKTIFYFLLIIFCNQNIYANAVDLLSKDLNTKIFTLQTEKKMYHYFWLQNTSRLNDHAFRENLVIERSYYAANAFWDLNNHDTTLTNAGPGLYLAIDPFSSSPEASFYSKGNFGDTMMELTFSGDTKYLSLIKPIVLSDETIQSLIEEKVLTKVQMKELFSNNHITQETFHEMVRPQYLNFRMLIQNILKNNQVVLLEYIWQSALQFFCNNHYIGSSMVYIGDDYNDPQIVQKILLSWPNINSRSNLTPEELEAYNRNLALKKTLGKLKDYESTFDSTGSSWIKNRALKKSINLMNEKYPDKNELLEIQKHLFKCVDN